MNTPRVAKSRILIVEDDQDYQRRWAKHCRRALEEIGFEADIPIAANAEEAKGLLEEIVAKKSLPFDLVTMDINLSGPETEGGTQGMDLLNLIADQADKLPGTCVIVISGSDNPVQMGEVWGFSEVVDYMRKDVARNEIVRIAAKTVVLHANTLRRLRDPRHPYKEWKSLSQWIGQIDTLQKELAERGWRKLRFTRPVRVEQMIYLDQDTGLPGPKAVEDRLKLLLREKNKENWALMIMQIDQLDRFAEVVGGEKGKAAALRLAAEVAGDMLEKEEGDHGFVGRWGDQIVVVTDLPNIVQVSSDIRSQFIKERNALYSLWRHRISDDQSKNDQLKETVIVESLSGEDREVKLPWLEVKIGTIIEQEFEYLDDVPDIERAIAMLVSQLK